MRRATVAVGVALLVVLSGCTGALGGGGGDPSLSFEAVGEETGFGYEATPSRTMNAGAGVYVSDYDTDG